MRVMAIAVAGCVTCGIVEPGAASAQVPGERIRVTLLAGRVVGVLGETGPDELVLALPWGGSRTVAHDEIRRLERSLGQRRKTMQWAKYGALGGTLFGGGLALGYAAEGCFSRGEADDDCSGEGLAVASFALISGLVGAGGSAVLGALKSDELWETIEAWNSPGPGERIRVTLLSGRIVGVLAEKRPGQLVLAAKEEGGEPRPIAQNEIQRLERSLGERGQARKGAIFGALGGVVLVALPLALGEEEGEAVAAGVFGGGLLGAGVGALAGALWKREVWETIDDGSSPGMAPRFAFDVRTGSWGRNRLFIGGQLGF